MSIPQVVETITTSPGRTTAETVSTSAGTLTGDTLVIIYGSDFYTLANMPDPTSTAGTPSLIGTMDNGNNHVHAKVYLLPVTTGGAKTVTFPKHIDCDIFGVVMRVPAELLVDDTFGTNLGGTLTQFTALVAPSRTSTAADRLLVSGWVITTLGSFAGSAMTKPASMTERGQVGSSPFSAMLVATEGQPVAAVTGTRTATTTGTNDGHYGAFSVLLYTPVVTVPTTPTPPEAPAQQSGGWWGLLSIFDEAASLAREERNRPPVACPLDGEPLQPGPLGVLFCQYDGWQYPRDRDHF